MFAVPTSRSRHYLQTSQNWTLKAPDEIKSYVRCIRRRFRDSKFKLPERSVSLEGMPLQKNPNHVSNVVNFLQYIRKYKPPSDSICYHMQNASPRADFKANLVISYYVTFASTSLEKYSNKMLGRKPIFSFIRLSLFADVVLHIYTGNKKGRNQKFPPPENCPDVVSLAQ